MEVVLVEPQAVVPLMQLITSVEVVVDVVILMVLDQLVDLVVL